MTSNELINTNENDTQMIFSNEDDMQIISSNSNNIPITLSYEEGKEKNIEENQKYKRNKKRKKHKKLTFLENTNSYIPSGNITFLIAFFLPLLAMIAVYFVKGIYPFGDECYLRSDMYHQYAPFFSELWDKIRNQGSFTYSWDIGAGVNFTALYAYYLASPANWFIALFPQDTIIEVMDYMIIIKMAAASVSMTYYLSKHFKNKSCSLSLIGIHSSY